MAKKTTPRAKRSSKNQSNASTNIVERDKTKRTLKSIVEGLREAVHAYLLRRPHRSFVRTRRRDYVRSMELPGYWGFTFEVWKFIYSHKKLFVGLVITYTLLGAAFIGLSSQSYYAQLSTLIDNTKGDVFGAGWDTVGSAGLLVLSGFAGGFSSGLTEAQQVYAGVILLLTWLTTVWLIRALMSGGRPRLRDGLYNSGAPIVPTTLVLFGLVLQLVPAAVGIIIVNAAIQTELFESGFIAMIIVMTVGLLIILSLYWAVSTLIALVIVTLPGMYPWKAIRAAGDITIGRRIRLLLRVLWMLASIAVTWLITIFIFVLIDRSLKSIIPAIEWLPIVPIVITVAGTAATVWAATYIYMLYRKVVDDDTAPA